MFSRRNFSYQILAGNYDKRREFFNASEYRKTLSAEDGAKNNMHLTKPQKIRLYFGHNKKKFVIAWLLMATFDYWGKFVELMGARIEGSARKLKLAWIDKRHPDIVNTHSA